MAKTALYAHRRFSLHGDVGVEIVERRAVSRYVPWSIGLFVFGMVFSFRWIVAWVLYYLATAFPTAEIRPQWRVSEYFSVL